MLSIGARLSLTMLVLASSLMTGKVWGEGSPAVSTYVQGESGLGTLVIAHGGSEKWNALVETAVSQARPRIRVRVGFLFDRYGPSVQEAFDLLQADGAQRVVAVPLMMSSHSGHMEEIEYLVGLRNQPPKHEASEPQEKSKEVAYTEKAEAASGHPNPHGTELKQIEAVNPVLALSSALDGHKILTDILLDRAMDLSDAPESESVILIAHGPNSHENAQKWLENLDDISRQIQSTAGFRKVSPLLLRDDAPELIRNAAQEAIRQTLEESSRAGRVLVVPVLISQGHVVWQIPKILDGLAYAWSGRALLPDSRIADWIVQQTRELDQRITEEELSLH